MTTTPTKNESLPELPKPYRKPVMANAQNRPSVKAGHEMGGYEIEPALYSADQMRDYARAALTREAPTEKINVEAMLVACVPGGSRVDPQTVADNIREWFATPPAPQRMAQGEDKPVAWWNGIQPDKLERSPYGPSIRWGADSENSGHDIPLYAGMNPIHFAANREARDDAEYERKYATAERLAKPAATEKCGFCGVRPGELHAFDCTALDDPTHPPHQDRGEDYPVVEVSMVAEGHAVGLYMHPSGDTTLAHDMIGKQYMLVPVSTQPPHQDRGDVERDRLAYALNNMKGFFKRDSEQWDALDKAAAALTEAKQQGPGEAVAFRVWDAVNNVPNAWANYPAGLAKLPNLKEGFRYEIAYAAAPQVEAKK